MMKLSEEEQEKKKFENYQMLSALTGKPISELTGEPSNRPNFKENYCLIKQLYLKNCAEPISSKDLFKTLQNQGYKAKYSTFRGLLNNYMKYGYIRKTNATKPFFYVLTDTGKIHAKNPFIAVDENIQRYRNMLYEKLAGLINSDPEQFKAIYESIFGVQNSIINTVVPAAGSQYSGARIEELKDDLETKIYSSDFWKNSDNDKLKSLVAGILDHCLTDEDKQELLVDAFQEAVKSNKTIILPKQYNSNPKSEGLRNYYTILANSINSKVTKSLYEVIPFRFIKVQNQLRLKSVSEAGTYRNNKDATELDFDYVNQNYFHNQMYLKMEANTDTRELTFSYAVGNTKLKITTMSFSDYEKAKGKGEGQGMRLKINT